MFMTVIIPTYNEEIHLERCLKSIQPIANQIVVVDSFSNDRTVEIAKSLGVEVIQHRWKNYADQFQWAIDHCNPKFPWLMRLDADEYLEPALQQELVRIIPTLPETINGIYIKRKVIFNKKWIRYGGFYPHMLLRIWRNGEGRIEQRWMDEHIVLTPGSKTITAQGHLVDENLKGITFWVNKHNLYASREAVDLLNDKYGLFPKDESINAFDDPQAKRKRWIKDHMYVKLPPVLRALAYFSYRYFFRLGFLDGRQGFIWHFMQGFWYRLLVDVKIMELEERSGGDKQRLITLLAEDLGIFL